MKAARSPFFEAAGSAFELRPAKARLRPTPRSAGRKGRVELQKARPGGLPRLHEVAPLRCEKSTHVDGLSASFVEPSPPRSSRTVAASSEHWSRARRSSASVL